MDSPLIARPIRILVVEDDPDDYRLIKTQIGLAKLADLADDSIVWAKTLLTGIDLAHDKKPDVVLLDLTLPDSFGMTTLQATRAALDLPIVILTGHDDNQLAIAMLQAGAEDYLVKSQIDANTLRRAVRNACIHHRLKHELEESRHRLELALDGGNLGLWDWDIASGRVGFNARLARLVGCNPNELGTHVDDWRQRVHRTDWPKILTAMNAHLKGETPAYDVEYRILHQDGHWVWVHDRGKVVERNAKGKPTRLIGTQSDIGARKRTELELSIAATAFEVQEGIFITDEKGAIERVNRAFTAITGYDATEALGNNPRLLSSQRHDAAFYRAMWHAVLHDGHWQGEIWDRRKNGEIFPGWLTITAIQGDNGEHIRYVATLTDITIRKAAEDEIRQLAFYDPLTNLPNRRLLLDHLQKALGNSNRTQRCGALLFIDLDNFKNLNDTLGHDKGDLLLQQVAQRLTVGVRDGDTVARLGGDEFVVLLEGLDPPLEKAAPQAEAVAEKILSTLDRPYSLAGNEHHSTPSIGIALFSDRKTSVDELLKRADLAMYQAKAAGRNTFRFFDPTMQALIETRATLESELREALRARQFLVHYQAQVDADGRLIGAEALLRWQHPTRGILIPDDFLPLAEETRLMLPIGRWVLETACAQLRRWAEHAATAHLTLAVNVGKRQFRQAGFVAQVQETLAHTGANPNRLRLELTENLLLENIDDAQSKMQALKALGVGFSLDDFGAAYSALGYLKHLPIDQLKIDRSFIHGVDSDPNNAAIARAVVALGRNLGLSVIAAGVETTAQRDCLTQQGCHAFQGFLFGLPAPIDHLIAPSS